MNKSEIMVVAALVEHNVPFFVIDHLNGVLRKSFHDSEIVKNVHAEEQKSSAIAYNVPGEDFGGKLMYEMNEGSSFFSIIIDESTDVSTKKVRPKFYSNRSSRVKTQLM